MSCAEVCKSLDFWCVFSVLRCRNFLKLRMGEKLFRGVGNYRMRALRKLVLLREFHRQGLFKGENMV